MKHRQPKRQRVVMDEKTGFPHIETLTPAQRQRLSSDTPTWLTDCRTTRTTTEGSQA